MFNELFKVTLSAGLVEKSLIAVMSVCINIINS